MRHRHLHTGYQCKKHGKIHQIGRQIAYNEGTKVWSALPAYYVRFPGLYRKDLWDEIGMNPQRATYARASEVFV